MLSIMKRNNQVRVHANACFQAASRGNTLLEYGVTGTLVMVACIFGLQFLEGNLNNAMAMIRDDMQARQKSAESMHALQVAMSNGQTTGTLSTTEQTLLQASLGQKLQTAGAGGSTEALADQLAASAALLLAQGKVNQSQYGMLLQLSNQGHQMGQIENLFSQAVTMAHGDMNVMNNLHFTMDGTTYSGAELASLVGYNGPDATYFSTHSVLNGATDSANPATAKFLALYQQALSSGALSDPTARSTVDSAATQIASISELVESTPPLIANGEATNNTDINAFNASAVTQMDSSNICTAGNFQANGVLCNP